MAKNLVSPKKKSCCWFLNVKYLIIDYVDLKYINLKINKLIWINFKIIKVVK